MKLTLCPLTLSQANNHVYLHHRHHKPVVGAKFSIGVRNEDGDLVGAAIVGRPVSREVSTLTAEVTRLVTDSTPNACSKLYAACARACLAMGYSCIQTYILESEPGITLKAAGWTFDGMTAGGDWNHSKQYAGKRRTDQPQGKKQRWIKHLDV